MRILRIRGQDLASLEQPFDVDLTTGGLGRAGLFAITGPTGAGKSTLLDAVCLCLYDCTPRLAARGGATVLLPGQDADAALPAHDVRNILRRGAGSGWAEVDFRGRDGRVWTARWEVRRARQRPDGKVQQQQLSLRDDQGRGVGGTKSETLEAIRARVGLDFEQFRRSVLLAQGDFAAFLRAGENERASLLEQMTGTEIYSLLSKAAFARSRALEATEQELTTRLDAQGVLATDARQAAEHALGLAAEQRLAAAAQAQQAEAATRWHQQEQALATALAQAQDQALAARQAWQAASDRRLALARAERGWPLRTLSQQELQAQGQAGQADGQAEQAQRAAQQAALTLAERQAWLGRARASSARACQGLAAQLERRLTEAQTALNQDVVWLEQHPRLQGLAAPGAVDGVQRALSRHGQARSEVQQVQTLRGSLEMQAPALALERDRAEAERAEAAKLAEAARTQEASARAALGACDREGLLRERRELELRLQAAAELARLADRADALAQARDRARDAGTQAREEQARAQQQAHLGREQALALAPRLDEAQQALDRARAALDAQGLRATLVPGHPCPVCGGLDHPWADGSPLAGLHGELHARVQALQLEGQAHQAQVAQADARAQAAGTLADQQASLADRAQADLLALATSWARQVDDAGAPELEGPADAAPGVLAWRQELEQRQADQARRELAATQASRALEEASRVLLVQQQLAARAESAAAAAAAAVERAGHDARQAADREQRALQALDQALSELQGLLDPLVDELPRLGTWRQELSQPATLTQASQALAQACQDAGKEAAQRLKRRDRARDALEQLRPLLATAERSAEDALARAAAEDLAPLPLPSPPPGLPAPQATEWLQDRVSQTHAALVQATADLETARQHQEASSRDAAIAAERARTLHQQTRSLADSLRQQAAALDLDDGALSALLALPADWLPTERAALQALEQAPAQAQALLAERQARHAEHQDSHPPGDPTQAQDALQAARAALAAADDAWSAARATVQADDAALARASDLQARIQSHQQAAAPWHQLSACIGSASGVEFKRFAQSLTLELLLEQANLHLRALNPRYSLARIHRTDLDLLVIDHDLGDEPRTVQSLSGGEAFLASLALALGLSSLSARDVRVESLFIDEGFGTLDAATLDLALAVLDGLQAEGRQVGVISHVGGLAERIGVQVQIQPLGAGRSGVRIVEG